MSIAGKLSLRIVWDGSAVLGVDVKSTRPKAYQILTGRMPETAMQLAPMLFGVCTKAQRAATMAAVFAARGNEMPQTAMLARAVNCEAMQEHLWRLLLDWPKLLGLPQEQEQFVRWHGELNAIAAGQGYAENLLAELRQKLLGESGAKWQDIEPNGWRNAGHGLCAPVFSALNDKEGMLEFVDKPVTCVLLPEWSASDVLQLYTGHFDHEFAAIPQHDGKAMETGALAHWQQMPLLQDLLSNRPARLLARLIARLVDLMDSAEALAHENDAGHIQSVSAPDGAGLSLVRTARGMLLHYARIETERLAEYLIVAPTEWNFHPQGALASGLIGLKEKDAERLMETVRYYVLSLDPCVEYEVEVFHA